VNVIKYVEAKLRINCEDQAYGYSVIVYDGDEVISEYYAGNAPWESTQVIPPNDKHALSRETLERYARITAQETAKEFEAEWDGVVGEDKEKFWESEYEVEV